jgi:F-type H+-transporting ATPase subunit epsilon
MENCFFIINYQLSIMLKLEIVTPEKKLVDIEADSVTVPTASGEAGILPNHAPLISALKPGVLSYTVRGREERVAVGGGFVEVNSDKVSVLADTAETADVIDTDAVRREREDLERQIADAWIQPIEETDALRERLDAANARLQLAAGR